MGTAPPITIRCECGDERSVPFGETWTCERCGRSWNTQQIPVHEYLARVRRMRRFRVELFGLLAIGLAVFVPLILFVNPGLIFLAGVVSVMFIMLYMPYWRRRVRRAVGEAPTWELEPQ